FRVAGSGGQPAWQQQPGEQHEAGRHPQTTAQVGVHGAGMLSRAGWYTAASCAAQEEAWMSLIRTRFSGRGTPRCDVLTSGVFREQDPPVLPLPEGDRAVTKTLQEASG